MKSKADMNKRKPYILDRQSYATKKSVTEACRTILRKAGGPTPDDFFFLFDMLAMHPEADQKIGCGVQSFSVRPDGFGGRCFWLTRTDGTETDWSFVACLKPPTHESDVRAAMRLLVTDQIIAFRARMFLGAASVPCAITGVHVTSDAAHIDHRPPTTFLALLDAFLAERNIAYADVKVKPTTDASTTCELEDAALAQDWCTFHEARAVLQVTASKANLSQGCPARGCNRGLLAKG